MYFRKARAVPTVYIMLALWFTRAARQGVPDYQGMILVLLPTGYYARVVALGCRGKSKRVSNSYYRQTKARKPRINSTVGLVALVWQLGSWLRLGLI